MNTSKQIYPLYLSRLRTNEVFGYLTSVINSITYLPDTGRDSAIINNRITQHNSKKPINHSMMPLISHS